MLASPSTNQDEKKEDERLLTAATREVLESSRLAAGADGMPDRRFFADKTTERAKMMAQQYGSSWIVTEDQARARSNSQELMFNSLPQQQRRQRRAKISVVTVSILAILFIASLIKKKLSSADGELGPFTKIGFLPLSEPHPVTPDTQLWGPSTVNGPYPTGAWWLNAVIDKGKAPVPATPYQLQASDYAISMSYSARRRVADHAAQLDTFGEDFLFFPTSLTSAADAQSRVINFEKYQARGEYVAAGDALRATLYKNETARSRFLVEHSHLGALMKYQIDEAAVTALLVKGAPAFSLEITENAAVLIASGQGTGGRIAKVENITTSGDASGSADLRAIDGSHWLLVWYGARLDSNSEAVLVHGLRPGAFVRLGYLPTESMTHALRDCPYTYPRGGHVDIDSDEDPGAYHIRWKMNLEHEIETDDCKANPPLLGLPHHQDIIHLKNEAGLQDSGYVCTKGKMLWIRSSHWTLWEKLPPMPVLNPKESPLKSDIARRRIISGQVRRDVRILKAHASFLARDGAYGKLYFEGKELARLARLVLVAEEVEDPEAKAWALLYLERRFERILRSDENFAYDSTWGGLISLPVAENGNPFTNFGNALYSDHHFHYGYYCYAAAVLCGEKSAWCRRWNRRIRDLVHDFANPPSMSKQAFSFIKKTKSVSNTDVQVAGADERFPKVRHKDWYDGHSWATGLVSYQTGKSQESSSEAAHAYFAVAVLGEALGDYRLRDWGRLLFATEVRSAQYYWHISQGSTIYTRAFSKYNRITGSVAGSATVAATWFGANPEYVHGIQTLPVVPGLTDVLFQSNFICDQLPIFEDAFSRPPPVQVAQSWRGVALANVAIVDPHAAWRRALELDETKFDDGASKANLLHWIATRTPSTPSCSFRFDPIDPDTKITSYNGLAINTSEIQPWCSSNLACVAFGLSGACCPQPDGYVFGCCPVLVREDGTAH